MAFPGTPHVAIENPVRLAVSLRFIDLSEAAVNDYPIGSPGDGGDAAAFNAIGNMPTIAINEWIVDDPYPTNRYYNFNIYGFNNGNWAKYVSDGFFSGSFFDKRDGFVDGCWFAVHDTPFSDGLTNGGIGIATYQLSNFTENALVTSPAEAPSMRATPTPPFAISTFTSQSEVFGGIFQFTDSTLASPIAAAEHYCERTDIFTPPYYSWTLVMKIMPDHSVELYNAYKADPGVRVYWYLTRVVDGEYVYQLTIMSDISGGTNFKPVVIRYRPTELTLDGAGPYNQYFLQLSIDIPALQDHFDHWTPATGVPNTYFSGSRMGHFIAFLDGTEWKYILLTLEGISYQYVDITCSDAGSTAMLADFTSQANGLFGTGYGLSNFMVYENQLYLISGPRGSTSYCIGTLSPFPGTAVLCVEDECGLIASLSSVDMSAAPFNGQPPAWDLEAGSSFFVTCQPPQIGLCQDERLGPFPLNYWTTYAYGVDGGHYALYESNEYFDHGQVLRSPNTLITDSHYFFSLDRGGLTYFGGFPTPTGGVALVSMPLSGFTDDTTHVYVAQQSALLERRFGPYTIATFDAVGGVNAGIFRWPGSSPSAPMAGIWCTCMRTDTTSPTPDEWVLYLQVFPDLTNQLWNAYRLGTGVNVAWFFASAEDDTYFYQWVQLRDDRGLVPSIPCLMRFKPMPQTLDGLGPFDQTFYQISFDIPALQAALDAFEEDTGYHNVFISGSQRGYFVAFLDGAEWKYIMVALDGSTYEYVDLVGLDPDAVAMIATFEAGTYSVSGSFNAVSNFMVFEDNLYLTAAPYNSADYCLGPLVEGPCGRRPNVIIN